MSTDEHKTVARRLREGFISTGDMAIADELLAPDFRYHGPPSLSPEPLDREAFKQLIAAYRQAFPDLRETVEEQLVDGDRVVQRIISQGTFRSEMMGMRPTGKSYMVPSIEIIRVVDGRISETQVMFDSLGFMQQIGIIAAPEETTHEVGT